MKTAIERKSKFLDYYFVVLILTFFMGAFLLSKDWVNYLPIYFMFASFVFFFLFFIVEFQMFAYLLKRVDLLLYKANTIQFGPYKGRRLNNLILFNCAHEIKATNHKELIQRYKLVVKLMKFVGVSFVLFPILSFLLFL